MTNDNESLIGCAAWGSWHADVPQGMVVVAASPGGSLAEARRHFVVSGSEYAARGESKFTIDPARHAEVFGFTSGIGKAPPALERTATGGRLEALMRQYGTGASQPARESESGQARPWGEVLKAIGFAKKAGSPGGATCELHKSPTRTATEQTTAGFGVGVGPGFGGGRALPWAEVLRRLEAEERAQ